jgi:hypothetical protein
VQPGEYKQLLTVTIPSNNDAVSADQANTKVAECPLGYACPGAVDRPVKCHNSDTPKKIIDMCAVPSVKVSDVGERERHGELERATIIES